MTASIQADRERVLSGRQNQTAGGLTKKDLVRMPDGHIASRAKAGQVPAALAARAAAQQIYLKSKGVGKGKKKEFSDYIVRKGTVADKAIKKLVKKML
jgi:hypothetical protein